MDYAGRARTATMGQLLHLFQDHGLYGDRGGVVQVTPDRLLIEEQRTEVDGKGGAEEWIYTTEIEVTVMRRRLH